MNLKRHEQLNTLQEFQILKTSVFAGNVRTRKMIALRPCVENLGLKWNGALERIKRSPELSELCVSEYAVGSDGKKREMICMSYEHFQEWLWSLNPDSSPNFRKDLWEQYKQRLVIDLLAMLEVSLKEIQRLKMIEGHFEILKLETQRLINTENHVDHTTNVLKEERRNAKDLKDKIILMISKDTNQLLLEFTKDDDDETIDLENHDN